MYVWFLQKQHAEDEVDVRAMMETWTLQEGFPLIMVEVRGREVRLSQERYLKGEDSSQTSGWIRQWLTHSSKPITKLLLNGIVWALACVKNLLVI